MTAVFIDTNMVNDDGTYYIDPFYAQETNLQAGEEVIAYQEDDQWDARVAFDGENWGVILTSDARTISEERRLGHIEGFLEGHCVELRRVLRILQQLDADEKLIREIAERF